MATPNRISRRQFLQWTGFAVGGSAFAGPRHDQGANLSTPKPLAHDIFLLDTHIAGTSYVEGIEALEPHLHIDEVLDLCREPENPYDHRAILIRNNNGVKLGYVPRVNNMILARLMDGGKVLSARITTKEMHGRWLRIGIEVWMHE